MNRMVALITRNKEGAVAKRAGEPFGTESGARHLFTPFNRDYAANLMALFLARRAI